MNFKRIKQVFHYGRLHAKQIAKEQNKSWLPVFFDILYCFRKYKMWSNQYLNEKFWSLSKKERDELGEKYYEAGKKRDEWQKDFIENSKFLYKYTHRKYELSHLREKRRKAYAKRYNMGKNCIIEHNVEISRQHYLPGTIKIGDNVLLAKNVFMDYSGELVIKNGVKITNGVIIETHHNDLEAYNQGKDIDIQTKLVIEEKAFIGSRAIILDSCNYIGKQARIGAGAVVTKDVPDYAVVVGVPAKVVRMIKSEEI